MCLRLAGSAEGASLRALIVHIPKILGKVPISTEIITVVLIETAQFQITTEANKNEEPLPRFSLMALNWGL